VRKHLADFGYRGIPAILDSRHKVVEAAGAKVTPEAILVGRGGKILYSGRIDNFYAGLGKPRRQATVHDLRTALEEILAGKQRTTLGARHGRNFWQEGGARRPRRPGGGFFSPPPACDSQVHVMKRSLLLLSAAAVTAAVVSYLHAADAASRDSTATGYVARPK